MSRRAGFDPEQFVRLAAVEDRHFWFSARNDLLSRIVAPLAAALPTGARILEIGTGTGNTLRVLANAAPHHAVVGIDSFVEGLQLARTRTRAHLVCGSAEHLPVRAPFHLAGAFDVIEHVHDDVAALSALHNVLAPGAPLVVTVPAFQQLWSAFDEAAHHCRRYERAQLRDALERAGFRIERLAFFMAAIYPVVRLARARRIGQARGAAVERELRIVPGVNAALRAILHLEARSVAAGLQLPFGTSLLAIAIAR